MDKAEIYALCDNQKPILIAGATASGKSSLAIALAQKFNGIIINADALQVYGGWSILTARPSAADLEQAPHHLYGHVPLLSTYSTGHWLRETAALLKNVKSTTQRPIIVGGTGLYFMALTEGLVDIPPISKATQKETSDLEEEHGSSIFAQLLRDEIPEALDHLDPLNPMRTIRAWQVWRDTGTPLHIWQRDTPAPPLPLEETVPLLLTHDVDWLNARIETRFDQMLDAGALSECQTVLDNDLWDGAHPSCKAIGAAELIQHIRGNMSLEEARSEANIQTRRYAKRQRTWARSKMKNWVQIRSESL
ncbi:MAG: tRNA (adenosine(37)-N6)-dimethylallyltransferase MiaA [Pseudomonadota bacterium]